MVNLQKYCKIHMRSRYEAWMRPYMLPEGHITTTRVVRVLWSGFQTFYFTTFSKSGLARFFHIYSFSTSRINLKVKPKMSSRLPSNYKTLSSKKKMAIAMDLLYQYKSPCERRLSFREAGDMFEISKHVLARNYKKYMQPSPTIFDANGNQIRAPALNQSYVTYRSFKIIKNTFGSSSRVSAPICGQYLRLDCQ